MSRTVALWIGLVPGDLDKEGRIGRKDKDWCQATFEEISVKADLSSSLDSIKSLIGVIWWWCGT